MSYLPYCTPPAVMAIIPVIAPWPIELDALSFHLWYLTYANLRSELALLGCPIQPPGTSLPCAMTPIRNEFLNLYGTFHLLWPPHTTRRHQFLEKETSIAYIATLTGHPSALVGGWMSHRRLPSCLTCSKLTPKELGWITIPAGQALPGSRIKPATSGIGSA